MKEVAIVAGLGDGVTPHPLRHSHCATPIAPHGSDVMQHGAGIMAAGERPRRSEALSFDPTASPLLRRRSRFARQSKTYCQQNVIDYIEIVRKKRVSAYAAP